MIVSFSGTGREEGRASRGNVGSSDHVFQDRGGLRKRSMRSMMQEKRGSRVREIQQTYRCSRSKGRIKARPRRRESAFQSRHAVNDNPAMTSGKSDTAGDRFSIANSTLNCEFHSLPGHNEGGRGAAQATVEQTVPEDRATRLRVAFAPTHSRCTWQPKAGASSAHNRLSGPIGRLRTGSACLRLGSASLKCGNHLDNAEPTGGSGYVTMPKCVEVPTKVINRSNASMSK
ncbi:hypothetical protein EJ04DRAFT_602684 [Polyplosphaeria fusca]|uniref:Uncharacterized protein n=1 Tax=Polyplosphaeria fusca TaxID=682080 RepID=A0A9P4RAE5_9PLEO|nr:hypothetical protein EJ04DRAFT_602684 [Polyplosphaeria fusca]